MKIKLIQGISRIDTESKFGKWYSETMNEVDVSNINIIDIKYNTSIIDSKVTHNLLILYKTNKFII